MLRVSPRLVDYVLPHFKAAPAFGGEIFARHEAIPLLSLAIIASPPGRVMRQMLWFEIRPLLPEGDYMLGKFLSLCGC